MTTLDWIILVIILLVLLWALITSNSGPDKSKRKKTRTYINGNLLSDKHYKPVEPWQRFGTEDATCHKRFIVDTPVNSSVDTSHITKIRPDKPSQQGSYWDDKSISRRESEYR